MEHNTPKFTIITSTFNAESCFEALAKSVLSQDYQNIEWIVIDGGSTDKTIDLIKKYQGYISYWISESDNGIYDAWNKGLKRLTGDWVIFLGADDFLAGPHVLNSVADFMNDRIIDNNLVYGKILQIDSDSNAAQELGIEWSRAKKHINAIMTIPNPGIFYRATLFTVFGGYDSRFKIAGDYEFLLRVLHSGVTPLFVNYLISYMGGDGISTNPEHGLKSLNEAALARKRLEIKPTYPLIWCVAYAKALVKLVIFYAFGKCALKNAANFARYFKG